MGALFVQDVRRNSGKLEFREGRDEARIRMDVIKVRLVAAVKPKRR
jgi:hypothetical protein